MVEEQHILFSKVHFQLAERLTKVGLWEWDLLQRQPSWSTQCKAILGHPPEGDLKYEDVLAQVHAADFHRVNHLLSESRRDGTQYHAEYRVIWPDGSLHWIAAEGQGIADENRKVVRLIGAILDITTQKQAEEIERAVGQQVQTILESITDGLAHTDQDEHITYINTQVERVSKVSREQALGHTVWEVYPEFTGSSIRRWNDYSSVFQRSPCS